MASIRGSDLALSKKRSSGEILDRRRMPQQAGKRLSSASVSSSTATLGCVVEPLPFGRLERILSQAV
jgi:hypothetical protein